MKKIKKLYLGDAIQNININGQTPTFTKQVPTDLSGIPQIKNLPQTQVGQSSTTFQNGISALSGQIFSQGVNALTQNIFGNSELGGTMGNIFSNGLSSVGNGAIDNLIKGQALTQGLAQNAGASLAGAGVGIAANYLGKGVTAAMGDSRLGRGVGAGLATGIGTAGGTIASNLISGAATKAVAAAAESGKTISKLSGAASGINPYALGAQVLGSALGAATGPSKEYAGRHGNITRTMDTVYDIAQAGVNIIPGIGQGISGIMALNKGLSNIFGSTDGMTKTDAILGSAFMPAPIKWLNMWGASKTGTFNNQSWQNTQKANDFMGNAFGNLNDKFDKAREEAGKTYGTFSQGAKRRAQANIDFANTAWDKVMAMADQNELQNIRSQAMTSINNQRYAQNIQGGFTPLARGKQGMKIFNNSINHSIGMRLLSGAALIDDKQMILSKCSELN